MKDIPFCKAPDPNTRTPKYRAPANACDAHCHIFGPGDKYPYAAERTYTPPDAPLERFKELQSVLGLERAVLVNASCHGRDNTVILDAIAQSSGKYRGVANADDTFTDHDFERLHAGGCRGVRFNFVKHLGGVPDMEEFHRVVVRTLERVAADDRAEAAVSRRSAGTSTCISMPVIWSNLPSYSTSCRYRS